MSENRGPLLTAGLSESHKFNDLAIIVFNFGLLGGFVSIQQRLPKIRSDELKNLAESWFSITLIPVNGGIFALILMFMFVGSVIQGELFPSFDKWQDSLCSTHGFYNYYHWLFTVHPDTAGDVAKLLFWSFVSGFCERFVPQLIRNTVNKNNPDNTK